MVNKSRKNPYIVGSPVRDKNALFGRETIFQSISDVLNQTTTKNIIFIQGQRRIGKTSLLFQIPEIVKQENLKFIYFDLQDKNSKSLGSILHELTRKIVKELNLDNNQLLSKDQLEAEPILFEQNILQPIFRNLASEKLVLLLDEFDILNDCDIHSAGGKFFEYLKYIIEQYKQLAIVAVVGRQIDDLKNLQSLFKESQTFNLDVLNQEDTEKLIKEPARGILEYEYEAIEYILKLSAGHPYFTQAICFALFVEAEVNNHWIVTKEDVEKIIDRVIENTQGGLDWFSQGLPFLEGVIFLGLAEAQERAILGKNENKFTKDPFKELGKYGVVKTEQLITALEQLIKAGFVEKKDDLEADIPEYRVKIELVRRWLVKYDSLRDKIKNLENSIPQAQVIYTEAIQDYQKVDLDTKLSLCNQVLSENPNHFRAIQTVAEIYRQQQIYPQAVAFYQRVYPVYPLQTEDEYVECLLEYGKQLQTTKDFDLAKQQFQQILQIDSEHELANQYLEKLRETLDYSFKNLTEFPLEIIEQYPNLKFLDLRNNKLKTLPPEIGQLTNLNGLHLGQNELTALPPEIGKLKKLERLYLANNQLTELTDAIGTLSNLTEIYLSSNRLEFLHPAIGELKNLKQLSLSKNQLTVLPDEIKGLESLKWLDVSDNKLTTLPVNLKNLTQLSELDVSTNTIKILPSEIGSIVSLNQLKLNYNRLTNIPSEIGKLSSLTELDLSYNQLTAIASEIGNLVKLEKLNISQNNLNSLPTSIQNIKNLTILNIHHNQLQAIPPEIGQLTQIRELLLHNNKLTSLPSEIGQIKQLTRLNLKNNQLTSLPAEIIQLVQFYQLKELSLEGNLLPIPPEIIWRKDEPEMIIKYYQDQLSQKTQLLNEAKVILVGEPSVGKTSLVQRLCGDEFDDHQTQTKGINILEWNIKIKEDEEIKLNIWDFGGQEIYHATHQFFLTQRSLYILVFDTRDNEEQNRLEYWLKIIESYGGQSPIIIVGNKIDQRDMYINQTNLRKKYKRNIKAIISTSCKDNLGIEELRKKIFQTVDQMPHVRDLIPLEWWTVKKQLESKKATQQWDYISYSEYQDLCKQQNITEDLSQRMLIRFLHDLGVVLNFQGDEKLEDTAILNPLWVTNGVYKIFNDYSLMSRYKGILYPRMLDRILEDPIKYPKSKHQFILDMMLKFELCFMQEDGGDREYLIPGLLPKDEPYTGEWDNTLAFQYHYNVLPDSIISRFIVKMKTKIHRQTYWRSGVVLAEGNNQALVKADKEEKKIFILIQGQESTRKDLRTIIRNTLISIHQTILGIEAEEKLVLPNSDPEKLVDYNYLRELQRRGEKSFIVYGIEERINVQEILSKFDEDVPYMESQEQQTQDDSSSSPTTDLPPTKQNSILKTLTSWFNK